jgi:RNA polymerase sigma-70 factor (ECF subfamily)
MTSDNKQVLPHLFRSEYQKIIAVISKLFGLEHIEIAEDIVSDTFLTASETWGQKGLPPNPTAWLYKVAKNKALDFLKHTNVFNKKVAIALKEQAALSINADDDLFTKNIFDNQLQMMFAICHPAIKADAQIGLSLNILCGFGADEIAEAFLSNRETIYKRLARAKAILKKEKIKIELPPQKEIENRLATVLRTLYLLFSEGYYSQSENVLIRKDLCLEAMRLNVMLLEHEHTNTPQANALMSLMCFHASRFDARIDSYGEIVLYADQDKTKWNNELIAQGQYYLNKASSGNKLSTYHIEAAIAYWHTHKEDNSLKWENILQLYNKLLQLEYSPMAALNRTYALAKANGNATAIIEAEKLKLTQNHLYHSLLGNLYADSDPKKAVVHFRKALLLTKSKSEKRLFTDKIYQLSPSTSTLT